MKIEHEGLQKSGIHELFVLLGNNGKLLSRVPDVVFEAHADVVELIPLKIFMLELVVLEVNISHAYVLFHSIHAIILVIDFHAEFELSVNLG